ncbi:hypothetical protein [Cohnella algarum]|uniref:hypothetical protein n=1 Tax=Cohnella algarum TaxID=2044859 RepID=UPI0019681EE9|nr:hypothetical protein [Cohnella algarum]MBN2982113.1 hypothetical protein [Cohnella algarum]
MLEFVQSRERKTGKTLPRVDFIQRETWNLGENAEKASPDWTKSNKDDVFGEKSGFDWTKSNQALPTQCHPAQPCSTLANPAYPSCFSQDRLFREFGCESDEETGKALMISFAKLVVLILSFH